MKENMPGGHRAQKSHQDTGQQVTAPSRLQGDRKQPVAFPSSSFERKRQKGGSHCLQGPPYHFWQSTCNVSLRLVLT